MSDLPAILAAIRADSDDGGRWLALASWFRDNSRDDEADAVRVFWPQIRANLTVGRSLDSALDLIRRNAARLGRRAREIEERVGTG